jgi:hypothetical protein
MPHPPRHTLELIHLPEGQISPEGAVWVNLSQVDGGWNLEGNIPVPQGVMFEYGSFETRFKAEQAAIDFATRQGVGVLYVEMDARRCD